MEIYYLPRYSSDLDLRIHSLQRYIVFYLGPQTFGIPSSIGVKDWNDETGKHYSIFFNVFVLMQVFNEINARKLKSDEYNVF